MRVMAGAPLAATIRTTQSTRVYAVASIVALQNINLFNGSPTERRVRKSG
jgi:hypothetical protein